MKKLLRFKKYLVVVLCVLPCVTIYYYSQDDVIVKQLEKENSLNNWESSSSIETAKHEFTRTVFGDDTRDNSRIDFIMDHDNTEYRSTENPRNVPRDTQSGADSKEPEQTKKTVIKFRKPPHRVSQKGHIDRSSKQGVQEKLIILTYMRSGSTLTGDLYQQNGGVFYMYEPLWYTEMLWEGKAKTKNVHFLDGSWYSITNTTEGRYERELQILRDVFSCNLMYLDYGTLKQYHMFSSVSTFMYARCAYQFTDELHIEKCLQETVQECLTSPAIVTKIIRGSMRHVYDLMKNDPAVKVLHLLRDPRGSMKSQYQVGMFKWPHLGESSYKHCQRVLRDLELAKIIAVDFPGRLFSLRYEDLVQYPVAATQQLYGFLHLTLSQEIKDYIWNITYAGNPDDCNICTTRRNASATAHSWRRRLSFRSIALIQSQCAELFSALGYRVFHDYGEQLNENIPTKYDISSGEFQKETTAFF
ncbi:unnamed protein product [Lymnaea stagnalis]|uniref:Sulfotransferase domain-containing protein n=1 Tax=Lymnaea stagnalis TaxID=6523 RepID=A0AAV2HQ28_LYMST